MVVYAKYWDFFVEVDLLEFEFGLNIFFCMGNNHTLHY